MHGSVSKVTVLNADLKIIDEDFYLEGLSRDLHLK